MPAVRILATLIFVLAIPAALLTSNIRFIASESRVYRYAVEEYDAEAVSGIDRNELLRAGEELRRYFLNDQEEVSIRVMEAGQEVPLFNAREVAHLKDVKDRFNLVNSVQEFSVIYIVAYIAAVVLWAKEVDPRRLALFVMAGSLLTLALIGAAGGMGLAGFDSAWEDFHEVLFSNDLWRLNPASDHLIQIYPPEFWETIVFFIGVLVAAQAALLLIGSGLYLGASRRRASRRLEPFYARDEAMAG